MGTAMGYMMDITLVDLKLSFFMSRSTSLQRWAKLGIFEREIAIYRLLAQRIGGMSLVTSGGEEEMAFQEKLPGIEILYNRWGLSPNCYSLLAPILHSHALRKATVYKTNQLDGAWTAILAAKLYHKPVIVRAGYLWAKNFLRQQGKGWKTNLINRLERFSFKQADGIIVTTKEMKRYINGMYDIAPGKITVIPNYVDINLFRPIRSIKKIMGRVCFIGRFTSVKNLKLLIESISPLKGVSLTLIGDGDERVFLEEMSRNLHVDVRFLGRLENQYLPEEINQAEIFILPSKFEGHPKALIEAMACGSAVIGTDVEGINTVIKHNVNGLLCQPNVKSVRQAVTELLSNPQKRAVLGHNARQFVSTHFDLDVVVEAELSALKNIVNQHIK